MAFWLVFMLFDHYQPFHLHYSHGISQATAWQVLFWWLLLTLILFDSYQCYHRSSSLILQYFPNSSWLFTLLFCISHQVKNCSSKFHSFENQVSNSCQDNFRNIFSIKFVYLKICSFPWQIWEFLIKHSLQIEIT